MRSFQRNSRNNEQHLLIAKQQTLKYATQYIQVFYSTNTLQFILTTYIADKCNKTFQKHLTWQH